MFKRLHIFKVAYEYKRIIMEFFNTYNVEYTKTYFSDVIIFEVTMNDRVFDAFCDTILELNGCGIYPIAC